MRWPTKETVVDDSHLSPTRSSADLRLEKGATMDCRVSALCEVDDSPPRLLADLV
jgi:hypothetical protein